MELRNRVSRTNQADGVVDRLVGAIALRRRRAIGSAAACDRPKAITVACSIRSGIISPLMPPVLAHHAISTRRKAPRLQVITFVTKNSGEEQTPY